MKKVAVAGLFAPAHEIKMIGVRHGEQVQEKLLALPYIREELAAWEAR